MGLGCCKVGAGSTLGSPALIADGAHSLSDVLTDVVAYWSYAAARLPPDADHPFGLEFAVAERAVSYTHLTLPTKA